MSGFRFWTVKATGLARVVPPTGFTATMTLLGAAALAFVAALALALAMASGRLALRWDQALSNSATVRISAPPDRAAAERDAALKVLAATPGVGEARVLSGQEMTDLLRPWFSPDLPLDALPLPVMITLSETGAGFDTATLRAALAQAAPDAVLDDHLRWQRPVAGAARWLLGLGVAALLLIAVALSAMITLAAEAALAANGPVIRTLRLVGARDAFIAGAFVRRFVWRGFCGALIGTAVAMLAVLALPGPGAAVGVLGGLGWSGSAWLWPLLIPLVAALIAFGATRRAAHRMLKGIR